jgi:hypothetical protein
LTGTYPNPTVATNANLTGDVTSAGNATTYNNTVPVAKGGTGDTGTAWAAYTPTVTCTSGTITTDTPLGRWKNIGKTVYLQVSVTIATLGTCTGNLNFSLPNSFTVNATGSIYPGGGFDSSSTIIGVVFYASGSAATFTFTAAPTTHTYYGNVTFEAT